MSPEAVIRPARPEDRPAIEAVVQEAYSVYIERIGKPPGPMLDDYATLIAQGMISVGEDANGQIAALVVLIAKADHLLLDNVAVRRDRQGQGHGRRMIVFAETEARRLGYRDLRLYTHAAMTENIALYTRLGFNETGRGEQAGYERVFMTKPVT